MNKPFIPVCEPTIGNLEREYLNQAFDSGWISSGGDFNQRLETEFSKYCGVKYGISVSNGTTALHLAIKALDLKSGDEVIVPNHNGIYGAFALFYENIKPVPVDAISGNWNINPQLIEEKITSKTKAILVVHMYGHTCDMDPINAVAKKYNLSIIEDAAEAHGAEYKHLKAGCLGDIATFSFFANKVMTSGEGGLIVTNRKDLADRCIYFGNQCFPLNGPRNFIHEDVGHNYRLTNIQAAIAYAQFKQIETFIDKRRVVNALYRDMLGEIDGISFQKEESWAKNIFWMTCITINQNETGFTRDDLEKHLAENSIQTRRLFVGMNRQPVFKKQGIEINDSFPVSDFLADNGLYLPSSSHLSEDHISRITETIKTLKFKTN